jgi:2'-5' RNA ligase
MRMFVAIDLNEGVIAGCREIMSLLEESGADLRIVKPENLHVTLKFLGEVREGDSDDICEKIELISGNFEPFRLSLSGLGHFGKSGSPRVIWTGISEGSDVVCNISLALEKGLSHIRRNGKEPSPHLTLARVRSRKNSEGLIETIQKLSDVKLGEVDVKEIKLKQSALRPDGPVYSDFRTFELGRKGREV